MRLDMLELSGNAPPADFDRKAKEEDNLPLKLLLRVLFSRVMRLILHPRRYIFFDARTISSSAGDKKTSGLAGGFDFIAL